MYYKDVFESVYPYNVIKAAYDIRRSFQEYDPAELYLINIDAFANGMQTHLTEREYQCIQLRFVDNLTYKEIGVRIQRSQERVRQIISKGLRKLYYYIHKKYMLITTEEADQLRTKLAELVAENKMLKLKLFAKNCESPVIASDDFDLSIDELDLSVRSYNALYRAGVRTIADLATKSAEDMMCIRNLGAKSLEEIKCKAGAFGITFHSKLDE